MAELYIGLMSGTSMDGIDAALVDLQNNRADLLATHHHPLPKRIKQTLQLLAENHPDISIDLVGETDAELGDLFAEAANRLLENQANSMDDVIAIGSHGQTIRHRPDLKHPFSMQIADPNRIAYGTGITTVADFRRKDMAAGGEGAPLAPAFHKAFFRNPDENRGILNIGGIANITYLPADQSQNSFGFDTGPGNMLMDGWIQQTRQLEYDQDGAWAASGKPNEALLTKLMEDAFLQLDPPKSTGREHYNLQWLQQQSVNLEQLKAEDVQASLCQFTSLSIQQAMQTYLPDIKRLIVCGGGVHNKHLMQQLRNQNPQLAIDSSEQFGLDPDWVEAVAFAWLAKQTLNHQYGNLPEVTGASKAVILGAIYSV